MKNLGWLGVLPSAWEFDRDEDDDEGTPGRKMLGGRPPAAGGAGRPGRSEAGASSTRQSKERKRKGLDVKLVGLLAEESSLRWLPALPVLPDYLS